MKTGIRWLPLLVLFWTGLVLLSAPAAHGSPATLINVDSLSDDSGGTNCTLRNAILSANTNVAHGSCAAGSDQIPDTIGIGISGIITLNTPLPPITSSMIINGIDPSDTKISGKGVVPVFDVWSNGTLELHRLTIKDGKHDDGGGAIRNQGTLVMDSVMLSSNYSGVGGGAIENYGHLSIATSTLSGNETAGYGGAIYNSGDMTVTHCVLTLNQSTEDGGALANFGGVVRIISSTLDANRASSGGAIHSAYGTATISSSSLMSNTASFAGGAVSNSFTNTMILSDTQIGKPSGRNTVTNGSGGAIDNRGVLTATNVALSSNRALYYGGGVHTAGGAPTFPSSMFFLNSTVSDNYANGSFGYGGGFYVENGAIVSLVNSTCSGNKANANGGCVMMESLGTFNLHSATVANNQADADQTSGGTGGGVSGGETLRNTIVAGNLQGNSYGDCAGTLTSPRYSLIQTALCTIDGSPVGNITGEDPLLGPLANNGGNTKTHALLSDSPAINGGDPAGCTDPNGATLTLDQRGWQRVVGGRCDIGAFEFGVISFLPLIAR